MKRATCFLFLAICPLSVYTRQFQRVDVVAVTPRGETSSIDQSQAISATFNQPMVPLRAVPVDEEAGPMRLTPAVQGKFRWLGTSTLSFIPARNLRNATAYHVVIPAGTPSVSGQTLPADVAWDFETPRPRVVSTQPTAGQKYVELDHSIIIRFNQPVDPAHISHWLSIRMSADGVTAYPAYQALRAPDVKTDAENWVMLRPLEKFRPGATVWVVCKAGLQGTEGLLGMKQEFSFWFSTHESFKFLGLANKDGFNPSEPLVFRFSTPVSRKEFLEHLVLSPEVKKEEVEWDWSESEIRISLPLQAETEYRGMILPGLCDQFGSALTDSLRVRFRTGSFNPSARMVTGQGILEAYASHKYPVTFINVDSVTLQMGRVNPDRAITVMQRLDYNYSERMMWEEAIVDWFGTVSEDRAQFTVSRTWKPSTPRNQAAVRAIDLDEVLGSARLGIVLVQLETPTRRHYQKALIQVTHLGITAKFSPENDLIWVTNLKDASPVAGAKVEIRSDSNAVLWGGTTDESGLAKAPGWARLGLEKKRTNPDDEWDDSRQPRQWVLVRKGDDVAFSSSEWNNGIEPWVFGIDYEWNPRPDELESVVFTDRGLYKAGEQVELKGIVRLRQEGTWKIPRKTGLTVTIKDSRDDEIMKAKPDLNRFGSFMLSIPLKASAALGHYSVFVKAGTQNLGYGTFRVEAFRAAEFQVTANLERSSYVVGDTVAGLISGRYLYGAPMKGAQVQWRLSASPSSWTPEGYDGYFFGPLRWLSRYSRGGYQLLQSRDTALDDQGTLRISSIMGVGALQGTQTVMLEGDVMSPSRQVISGRTSVLVHGGEYAIGVGLSSTFAASDSALEMKFVAVAPNGTPVAGASIDYRLSKRIWRSVRKAETGGRYAWTSVVEDVAVDSAVIQSAAVPQVRIVRPREAGFYVVEAQSRDRRGNELSTNAYFYVSGSSYVPWERRDDDRIELIADKANYKPGETARIIVKSPYEKAPALISIEREGVIQHFTMTLTGSAPEIHIPVTKDHLPNIFVSVVLLQGRVEGAAITRESDMGRPSFKIGYVGLPVSPDEKKLAVKVATNRTDYRPGDTVEVSIVTAVGGNGAPAEVALSVADLGVLSLIAYRLPDPFTQFYRPRGLAVTTTESRIHLVQQRNYDEKGEEAGGGGANEAAPELFDAEGVRRDFRPLAYWNPSVMTDAQGRATVRFKLPDNLTSFQLMAVGQTLSSEFGYGESVLRVNKPLLLQPAFPRFARVGDRCEGGVVITNTTSAETTVRLVTTASGISFKGRDTMVIAMKPGQAKEVRHRFDADRLGTAAFTFRAWTQTDSDGLQWRLPVTVPRRKEAAAVYETTTDARVQESVQPPAEIFPDLGGLEFTASSTAMVGLSGGMAYLFEYPYGCLEQRLSRVLPMILAKEIVEAFKFDVLKGQDYRTVVERMLGEVPLFQRDDGGFSYWKNTDETWPYLSAFTMLTLVEAERHGYPVDKPTMERGMSYLRAVLAGSYPGPFRGQIVDWCTQALTLYTLALKKTPDFGYMEKLYTRREELPLFVKAYLLRALKAANGNASMIEELARDMMNRAKIAPTSAHFEEQESREWSWVFHSNVRTTALVLQALSEAQPGSPILPKVVRWLLDQRRAGCWRTTQENLYVVDALAAYFRAFEQEDPRFRAEIRLAGKAVLLETFEGRSLKTSTATVPMAGMAPGQKHSVDVLKTGPGRLYYGIRMLYYPKLPTGVREEGLSISKTMEGAEQRPDGRWVLKAGSVARVTLTVSTPQERSFVVVDDPLPAGVEAINLSFATTARNLTESTARDREWWWTNPFRHREMKDDRVLFFAEYLPAGVHTVTYLLRVTSFGTFGMPGTHVEGMYEPEVFGQTADQIVQVQ